MRRETPRRKKQGAAPGLPPAEQEPPAGAGGFLLGGTLCTHGRCVFHPPRDVHLRIGLCTCFRLWPPPVCIRWGACAHRSVPIPIRPICTILHPPRPRTGRLAFSCGRLDGVGLGGLGWVVLGRVGVAWMAVAILLVLVVMVGVLV